MKQEQEKNPEYIFVPYYNIVNNPRAFERLRVLKRHIFYDRYLESVWIRRGSTAHSLAVIVGLIEHEDKKEKI